MPPQNILSRHFEKYLHGMVLKLSGHVRSTISLLYKQKTGWNSDIWNFFSEKIDFFSILVYFHWNSAFWVRQCLKTSLWRHTLTDFHDFGINGKRRPYPIPWYQQSYFGPVNFKFMRGNHPPLVNHVTKKGLVGRGLMNCCTKLHSNLLHLTHICDCPSQLPVKFASTSWPKYHLIYWKQMKARGFLHVLVGKKFFTSICDNFVVVFFCFKWSK